VLLAEEPARTRAAAGVFEARCLADDWPVAVRSCFLATRAVDEPRGCRARLSPAQRTALTLALAAQPAAPASSLPRPCRDYLALLGRLDQCGAFPPRARAALEQAFRDFLRARENAEGSPSLDAQCRQMTDGLQQAVTSICGW